MRATSLLVTTALAVSCAALAVAAPATSLVQPAAAAPAKVVKLKVKPRKLRVAKKTGGSYRVMAELSDGTRTNVTSRVRWHSSRTRQPVPDATGFVAATKAGRTRLVARLGSERSKAAVLRVAKRRPLSLALTPGITRLPQHAGAPLRVYAGFGTWQQDVTPWSSLVSSAPAVVAVEGTTVRAVTPGRARVKARFRGRTSEPLVIDVPSFVADYESGTLSSGVPLLVGSQQVTAPDAASIEPSPGRPGRWAIAHKVTLGDPAYVSGNAPRSESSSEFVSATLYRAGDQRRYFVSLSLQDWQDWEPGATPIDIVWQFKRLFGLPDIFVGVKRNALILRYSGTEYATLVGDLRPYDGAWIDLRLDVTWATDDTGALAVEVRLPGTAYVPVFSDPSLATMLPDSEGVDHGYLKWGIYRPDSKLEEGAPATRVALHDDVIIELG